MLSWRNAKCAHRSACTGGQPCVVFDTILCVSVCDAVRVCVHCACVTVSGTTMAVLCALPASVQPAEGRQDPARTGSGTRHTDVGCCGGTFKRFIGQRMQLQPNLTGVRG